jgi:hypothetical protein
MSDGFDAPTAYGQIEGFDDPSMGWARCVWLTAAAAATVKTISWITTLFTGDITAEGVHVRLFLP